MWKSNSQISVAYGRNYLISKQWLNMRNCVFKPSGEVLVKWGVHGTPRMQRQPCRIVLPEYPRRLTGLSRQTHWCSGPRVSLGKSQVSVGWVLIWRNLLLRLFGFGTIKFLAVIQLRSSFSDCGMASQRKLSALHGFMMHGFMMILGWSRKSLSIIQHDYRHGVSSYSWVVSFKVWNVGGYFFFFRIMSTTFCLKKKKQV